METALNDLQRIAQVRAGVSDLSIAAGDAIGFYTGINGNLLAVPGKAISLSQEPEISRALAAYYEFLQGKERAGIERAVLSNSFAAKAFGPGMYRRFVELVTQQSTYFSSYEIYATDAHDKAYRAEITRRCASLFLQFMYQTAVMNRQIDIHFDINGRFVCTAGIVNQYQRKIGHNHQRRDENE